MLNKYHFLAALLLVSALTACDESIYDTTNPAPLPITTADVVTGSGDVTTSVANFRIVLGEPRNGGTVGPATSGRREVNWDGVPSQFNNADNRFPADFFNTNVKLGLVLSTSGSGFRNDTTLFGDLSPALVGEFAAFSPNKIFSPSGANVIDVQFRRAGEATTGVVAGFGAVFVDVDVANRTTLEFFDRAGKSLGTLIVPVRSGATALSFAGARFPSPLVASVRITLGTGALISGLKDISSGGTVDAVALDDFLYTEPQPL
ncbi:MAG: hypothetical protein H7099_06740 [Gemmatimonadaceae bacterium]|nr:hypothetical protein [Gemmatimonadaceae bacterium]